MEHIRNRLEDFIGKKLLIDFGESRKPKDAILVAIHLKYIELEDCNTKKKLLVNLDNIRAIEII